MKVGLIRQPAGVGDIFFTQKIAKKLLSTNRCNKILWPVSKQYDYIGEYLIDKDIEFVCEDDQFEYKEVYNSPINTLYETEELLYVPLQHADQTIVLPDHRAHGHIKYKFCNLSYDNWKEYFNLQRNLDRENKLVDRLNIDINDKYNLINPNYGTYPGFKTRADIQPTNNYKNVYMSFIKDIHLFDWLKIAENAQEIHTMETSVCFLLEKINLTNVFVYSKYTVGSWNKDNFGYIKDNYSKDWNFVR